MWIWTLLELYIAIAAASVPALKPFYVKYVGIPVKSALSSYARSRGASQGKKSTQNSSQAFSSLVSSQRRSGYQDVEAATAWKSNYEMRVVAVDAGKHSPNEKPPMGITRETTVQVDSDPRAESWPLPPTHFRPGFPSVRESEEVTRKSNDSEDELNLPRHDANQPDSVV